MHKDSELARRCLGKAVPLSALDHKMTFEHDG
jgi:hypothetical protein